MSSEDLTSITFTASSPSIQVEEEMKDSIFKVPPLKQVMVDDPPLNYTPPSNVLIPTNDNMWWFEVLKGGVIIEEVRLSGKPYFTVGRLPSCDISMLHDSISRYHCVVQWMQPNECFLYDLSTHGTYVNKKRIPKQMYVPLFDGDFVRFGNSSRQYIVHGVERPSSAEVHQVSRPLPSSTSTPTKLLEVSWGMQDLEHDHDDAVHSTDKAHVSRTSSTYYSEEPKKLLQQWLTSRGVEMKMKSKSLNDNEVYVRVHIPKDDNNSIMGDIIGEAVSTSRKESEKQAMLQVLQALDQLGELDDTKVAVQKAQLKAYLQEMEEDLEHDEYYDRSRRLAPASSSLPTSKRPKYETLESLTEQLQQTLKRQDECHSLLRKLTHSLDETNTSLLTEDSLDAYMQGLESQRQKEQVQLLEKELLELNTKIAQLQKYIALVTPKTSTASNPGSSSSSSALSLASSSSTVSPIKPSSSKLDIPSMASPKTEPRSSPMDLTIVKSKEKHPEQLSSIATSSFSPPPPPPPSSKNAKGPTLPSNPTFISSYQATSISMHPKSPDDNKTIPKKAIFNKPENEKQEQEEEDEGVEKVIEWLPPKNQSGDGKTSLNDLYGY